MNTLIIFSIISINKVFPQVLSRDILEEYAGIFAFDSLEIIYQNNYEISEAYFDREITITFDADGFFTAINFPYKDMVNSGSFRFELWSDGSRMIIMSGGANGQEGGLFWQWYFSDTNIIYLRFTSILSFFHLENGEIVPHSRNHNVEYIVRYVRR